ncbi:hypothetical protein L288_20255 [Sphingobium quisquiliarum P25]|uniref:Dibenzothiophene monooxygenase n=1 Tax=Sphingobium quisquiliarum P25 TaxID=1329909 RepID=T0HM88_9SPHN|nr:acyl-CoA dehydrogenase family protein [Sphingobium quisquiliarum]EQA98683.1 hypothetical protein L288_20255 [Sphingobium quisquiliarum P25]
MSIELAEPTAREGGHRNARPHAVVLGSEAQAVAAARAVADAIRPLATDRSRESAPPAEQLDILFQSGVPAIAVPKALGGLGASIETIADTVRIISHADGGIGQILQLHNVMIAGLFNSGMPETRAYFAPLVLRGDRFANALAEVGGKNKLTFKTTLTPRPEGGHVLNGRKFYATGSYLADWLMVGCAGENGAVRSAYVPRNEPGVTVIDDWRAFGQRNTMSGTVIFEDVIVPDEFAPDRGKPARTGLTLAQILHAAIDTGIARGALDASIDYLQHHSRAWIESGQDRIADEAHVIKQIGELASAAWLAEVALRHASQVFDRQIADPQNEELTTEAILAVANARVQSDHASLRIGTHLFDLLGASAVLDKWNLDRFWRNARAHTTHDPIRWRLHAIGDHALNGATPVDFPLSPENRVRFLAG